ncbi:MAG: glycoside hydrolase family 2 protein, partial [Terracidiphilus sp.]
DNLYWWSKQESSLRELDALANVKLSASATMAATSGERQASIKLENTGTVPALLVKLTLKDAATNDRILPAYYSENYVSLLPGESRTVTVAFPAGESKPEIALRGWNLEKETIAVR